MVGIKKALVIAGKVLLGVAVLDGAYRVGQDNGFKQGIVVGSELGADKAFDADDACANPTIDEATGVQFSFQGENEIPLVCAPPGYTRARLTVIEFMAKQISNSQYDHP